MHPSPPDLEEFQILILSVGNCWYRWGKFGLCHSGSKPDRRGSQVPRMAPVAYSRVWLVHPETGQACVDRRVRRHQVPAACLSCARDRRGHPRRPAADRSQRRAAQKGEPHSCGLECPTTATWVRWLARKSTSKPIGSCKVLGVKKGPTETFGQYSRIGRQRPSPGSETGLMTRGKSREPGAFWRQYPGREKHLG